jgi:hypothetical protein
MASNRAATVTVTLPGRVAHPVHQSRLRATGATRTLTIVTRHTNFAPGVTQASFGPGVSVGGAAAGTAGPVTVVDATTLTAQVSVGSSATLGARTVTVATGSEQASKDKGFTVGSIDSLPVLPNLNYRPRARGPRRQSAGGRCGGKRHLRHSKLHDDGHA